MKINKFKDIQKFPHCSYRIDVSWDYIERQLEFESDINLDLNPDFQRLHVWTKKQQTDYCEYILRNGASGRELYFNCVGWGDDYRGPYVIVDGKQRLEAVRAFMRGDIKVFGSYITEYKDSINTLVARFSWNVAALETRKEVLEWYVNFNNGGTVHTKDEINRVKDMIKEI